MEGGPTLYKREELELPGQYRPNMLGIDNKSGTLGAKDERWKNHCQRSVGAIPGPLAIIAVHKDYFASKECARTLEASPALKCPGYPGAVLSLLKNFTFPECLPWTPLVASFDADDDEEDDAEGELVCSKWIHKAICIRGASCFPDTLDDYPHLNDDIDQISRQDEEEGKRRKRPPAGASAPVVASHADDDNEDAKIWAKVFGMRAQDLEDHVVYVLATHSGLIEYAASGPAFRFLPATLRSVSLNGAKAKLMFATSLPAPGLRPRYKRGPREKGREDEEEDDDGEYDDDEEQEKEKTEKETRRGEAGAWPDDGPASRRFLKYSRGQPVFRSRVLAEQARSYVEGLRRLVPELAWRDVVQMNRRAAASANGALGGGAVGGLKQEGLKRRLMKTSGNTGPLRAIALDCLLHYMNSAEAPNEDLDVATWPLRDLGEPLRRAYSMSLAGVLCPVLQEPKGACRNINYAFAGKETVPKKENVYNMAKQLTLAEPAPLEDLKDLCRLLAFDKPLIAEALRMGRLYRGSSLLPNPAPTARSSPLQGGALEAYPKVLVCYRQMPSASNCWNRLGMQTRSGAPAGGPGDEHHQSQQQGFLKNDHVSESAHRWYLAQQGRTASGRHPVPVWRPYYSAHNELAGDRRLFPGSKSLEDFGARLRALWAHIDERAERFASPASADDSQKNIAIFQYNLSKSAYHLNPLLAHCFLASLFHQFVQLVFGTNIEMMDFTDTASAVKWFLDGCAKHVLKNMQNDTCGLKTRALGAGPGSGGSGWMARLPVREGACEEYRFPTGPDLCAFVSLSQKTTLYSMGDHAGADTGGGGGGNEDDIKARYWRLSRWDNEVAAGGGKAPGLDELGRLKVGTFLLDSALDSPAADSDPEAFLGASPRALRYVGELAKLLASCWGDAAPVGSVSQFVKMLSDAIVAMKIGLPVGVRPMSKLVGLLPYFNRPRNRISYHREDSVQEFHRGSPYVASPAWFNSFRGKRNDKLFFRMTNHTIHYVSFPDVHAKLTLRVPSDRREIYCIVMPTSQYLLSDAAGRPRSPGRPEADSLAERIGRKIAEWGGNNVLKRRDILLKHLPELTEMLLEEQEEPLVAGEPPGAGLGEGVAAATPEYVQEVCVENNIPWSVQEKLLISLGLSGGLADPEEEERRHIAEGW